MKRISVLVAVFVAASAQAAGGAAKPVNVSGAWTPKYWTVKLALQQEGDRVVGSNAGKTRDHFFRGQWDGGRLLLVNNQLDLVRKKCTPRGVMVVQSKGTVSSVQGVWFQGSGKPLKGPWKRESSDAGETFTYPWKEELQYCGMLRTYELTFASGKDAMNGTEWPILGAVAELLKNDPALKIEVAGHTDSTGDAAKNQKLSEQRAEAVKKALVEKYGADAARIATKGWGAEQAIEDNATEDGRAVNRRVEIVLAR